MKMLLEGHDNKTKYLEEQIRKIKQQAIDQNRNKHQANDYTDSCLLYQHYCVFIFNLVFK